MIIRCTLPENTLWWANPDVNSSGATKSLEKVLNNFKLSNFNRKTLKIHHKKSERKENLLSMSLRINFNFFSTYQFNFNLLLQTIRQTPGQNPNNRPNGYIVKRRRLQRLFLYSRFSFTNMKLKLLGAVRFISKQHTSQ